MEESKVVNVQCPQCGVISEYAIDLANIDIVNVQCTGTTGYGENTGAIQCDYVFEIKP